MKCYANLVKWIRLRMGISSLCNIGHKQSYVNDYPIQNDASQSNWFVFWSGRVEGRK